MKKNLITLSSDTNRPFHSKYRPNYFDDIIGQEHIVSYFKNLDLPKIFKETAVIIIAVAVTEFVFLTYLGSKYTSVDPNGVKAHLIENLNNCLP
jgi:hypothetical protein